MGPLLRFGAVLALLAASRLPAGAQNDRCSQEAFTLDGTAIRASFCVPATPPGKSVSVAETFAAGGKTIAKSAGLEVVPGAEVSRTIDAVDLAALGPKRVLHLTLAYRKGTVVLEHALATPGAIPVK